MNKSQMLKGLLEGCILEIISKDETYGYEITSVLSENGFGFLNEASVYTVLMRLAKKSLVKGEIRVSPLGPKRKYFSITEDGLRYLEQFKVDWEDVNKNVSNILNGDDK